MKIAHLSYSPDKGGAAIAAARLNNAMNKAGIESSLVTMADMALMPKDPTIFDRIKFNLKSRSYWRKNNYHLERYDVKGTWSDGFSLNRLDLNKTVMEADVVYVHWVNFGMLSIEEIGRLLDTGKPVVWVMHDMWPITGGCHASLDCTRYQSHCSACPMLSSPIEQDPSYKVFERKLKCFSSRSNLTMVSPSRWLADCAKKSPVFGGNRIETIPNIVDTEVFRPADKGSARKSLGFPEDKKILLFGCDLGTKNYYKGWRYLEDALQKMDLSEYELAVFGQEEDPGTCEIMRKFNTEVHFLGYLKEEQALVTAYSAADAFISPTLAESFGLTLAEAGACGTPVVCFGVGGTLDVIKHKETGYLAEYRNSDDLIRGIEFVTEKANSARISANARKHIVDLCSEKNVFKLHADLVNSLYNCPGY